MVIAAMRFFLKFRRMYLRSVRSLGLYCSRLPRLPLLQVSINFKVVLSVVVRNHSKMVSSFQYPDVPRDETVKEEHFGHQILDPYRWLEDSNSVKTQEFVKLQNQITDSYLSQCAVKDKIKNTLTKIWNYPKYSNPYIHGGKCYFYKNSGLDNQSIFYVKDAIETPESEATVFLNPNELSEDGTIAITSLNFSEDDKLIAYGLSKDGSDWYSIHFLDVASKNNLPDVVENVKFSHIDWTHDNEGVFYSSFSDNKCLEKLNTTKDVNHKLYYHKLGTQQCDDVLVCDYSEDPNMKLYSNVSDCGKYLFVSLSNTCKNNMLYYSKIPAKIDAKLEFVKLIDNLENEYEYITNFGNVVVIKTNHNAKNYRLVAIDLDNSDKEHWTELIPDQGFVLEWVERVNKNNLVVCNMQNVCNQLKLYEVKIAPKIAISEVHQFPLDIGSICGFSGDKDLKDIFFKFTSYLTPGMIYHCDLSDNKYLVKLYQEVKVACIDLAEYKTEQIFYESLDGTKVPMFIVCKKDAKLDGSLPCLLYGYGGFNVSLQPTFQLSRMLLLKHFNGIYAVANIRGGGEFGDEWHDSGKILKKQNCFDDFHAAAMYLVKNNYTSKNKLIIEGGSNGGLLVAACVNQRPELYGAVLGHVGVLDMLRFHKFTTGSAWVCDYGSPEVKEEFEALLKYSPLHNIGRPLSGVPTTYPATLLLTADHDDRVVPAHSFKFIAELQRYAKQLPEQKEPLLIRIDTKSGHSAGKPTGKVIDEITDIYSFLTNALNLQFVD